MEIRKILTETRTNPVMRKGNHPVGRFEIDNSGAERGMRQLANERKNSGFFGSHKMAAASAVYHTLIATCRKTGVSIKEYFKKLFSEIIHGNEDWAQLLPMTIGIPVNKI